ncbi:cGMP-specific 3',5'-cyclic phosphodiesterase [Armadillidium nasatum]|uniref:cGMP-specific 3',5'-cyclic phosphodiesterase n=1 Tax=Armadillidium nasatum TaxID=96803 RepID=A0A5N5SUY3_9CRUS|nr:cGMP-specific 3',5'-cyclic phosphodiesterase [Armadillidium nasatum]
MYIKEDLSKFSWRLEQSLSNAKEKEILLPWGVGIVGHVASTKEIINIKDAYKFSFRWYSNLNPIGVGFTCVDYITDILFCDCKHKEFPQYIASRYEGKLERSRENRTLNELANIKTHKEPKIIEIDPRFDASVDQLTGYRTISVLCMPVCNFEGEVIGVAEIINKKNGTNEFTPQDVEVFRRYLTFCGIGIQNAQLFDMSMREYKRNQMLLQLAKGIFEEQTSLDRLVTKIMTDATDILKCERCAVYLLDLQTAGGKDERGSKSLIALEGKRESIQSEEGIELQVSKKRNFHTAFELRASKGESKILRLTQSQLSTSPHAALASYVSCVGMTINISDVQGWMGAPLETEGLLTFSVLTIPIFNSAKQIVGVAQMINKKF